MPMLTIAHFLLGDVVFLLRLFCALEDLRGNYFSGPLLTLAHASYEQTASNEGVDCFIWWEIEVWNCTMPNVLNQANTSSEGPSNSPLADALFRTSDLEWKIIADVLFRTSFLNKSEDPTK